MFHTFRSAEEKAEIVDELFHRYTATPFVQLAGCLDSVGFTTPTPHGAEASVVK